MYLGIATHTCKDKGVCQCIAIHARTKVCTYALLHTQGQRCGQRCVLRHCNNHMQGQRYVHRLRYTCKGKRVYSGIVTHARAKVYLGIATHARTKMCTWASLHMQGQKCVLRHCYTCKGKGVLKHRYTPKDRGVHLGIDTHMQGQRYVPWHCYTCKDKGVYFGTATYIRKDKGVYLGIATHAKKKVCT